ncbi:GNAT family N-acetyltransferase [Ruania alba]|uniref:Acetyltransferase (GNAT) family protein n=1 Tax=Ruania alba TaxID=648782 RepID=A0A1H5HV22_9MICO|nr:GNAT family N-acetyltransferase [Ruania alba]SEE31797.1 Acetyltransferase (GNAT) family protein [Ruania alba]
MITIERDQDADATCTILESLPDWFGDLEAVDSYVADASSTQFTHLVARSTNARATASRTRADNHGSDPDPDPDPDPDATGRTVGIAQIERHFPESAELHLIAVAPQARGEGVGRALVESACADLVADGCSMLTVHTVGPTFEHEPYAQTRAFYRRLGFVPLEEHTNLDWPGPTVIMVRPLRVQVSESSA